MFPLFLYCASGHCLSKSLWQLMLASVFTSWNSENKIKFSAQVRLYFDLLKKKLVWFYSLYRFFFFLSKNVISLYIFKFFFIMLNLKISLEYWIILYIFRISLCVTSPLHLPLVVEKYAKFTRVWPISSQCLISIPLDNASS